VTFFQRKQTGFTTKFAKDTKEAEFCLDRINKMDRMGGVFVGVPKNVRLWGTGGSEAAEELFLNSFSRRALCALRGNKIGRAPRGAMTFFQRKQAGFTTKFAKDTKEAEFCLDRMNKIDRMGGVFVGVPKNVRLCGTDLFIYGNKIFRFCVVTHARLIPRIMGTASAKDLEGTGLTTKFTEDTKRQKNYFCTFFLRALRGNKIE
jgi:hypothetical protein